MATIAMMTQSHRCAQGLRSHSAVEKVGFHRVAFVRSTLLENPREISRFAGKAAPLGMTPGFMALMVWILRKPSAVNDEMRLENKFAPTTETDQGRGSACRKQEYNKPQIRLCGLEACHA